MKVHRKKSRKLLYQELYASTFAPLSLEDFYASFYDDTFDFEKDEEYLQKMDKIIKNKEGFFIHVIEKYSPKFEIEQMAIVNILPVYISLAEIFFLDEEIPIKSSINEGIELAKIYSDDSSKKIVNGILDKVLNEYDELNKIKDENFEIKYSIFK